MSDALSEEFWKDNTTFFCLLLVPLLWHLAWSNGSSTELVCMFGVGGLRVVMPDSLRNSSGYFLETDWRGQSRGSETLREASPGEAPVGSTDWIQGWTDRRTDGQMDRHPMSLRKKKKSSRIRSLTSKDFWLKSCTCQYLGGKETSRFRAVDLPCISMNGLEVLPQAPEAECCFQAPKCVAISCSSKMPEQEQRKDL